MTWIDTSSTISSGTGWTYWNARQDGSVAPGPYPPITYTPPGGPQPLDVGDVGTSTDTGDLTVTRGLAVADAGSSTDTADATAVRYVSTLDAGASSDTAAVNLLLGFATDDTGTSTDTAAVDVTRGLATIDAGTSTDTGVLLEGFIPPIYGHIADGPIGHRVLAGAGHTIGGPIGHIALEDE